MIDVIILLIIIALIAVIFKNFNNTIIFIGLIDATLRILEFVGNNTTHKIHAFISKYFPASIGAMIRSHSSGMLETVLMWVYVVIMFLFVVNVFKVLLRRI